MEQYSHEKTQHEKELDEKHKDTILKEQLWFTFTMLSYDAFVIQATIGKINAVFILLVSVFLNLFSIHLILDRARAYMRINNTNSGGDLKTLGIIIKERSGSLFYVSLIFFSFIGVLLQLYNNGQQAPKVHFPDNSTCCVFKNGQAKHKPVTPPEVARWPFFD